MYAPMYIYCYHIMVYNLHKVITIKHIKHVAIPLIGISLAKNNLMIYVILRPPHGKEIVTYTHMTNTRITESDPEILDKRYFNMTGYFFCNRC